jgi:hypothetical protein
MRKIVEGNEERKKKRKGKRREGEGTCHALENDLA